MNNYKCITKPHKHAYVFKNIFILIRYEWTNEQLGVKYVIKLKKSYFIYIICMDKFFNIIISNIQVMDEIFIEVNYKISFY